MRRVEGNGSDGRAEAPPAPRTGERPTPSSRSQRGLDWFIFFLANVQTGFGPFIAVYLTSQAWTQVDIGLVLTVGGLVALLGQMPGGALVDAARSERLVAALSVFGICASAISLAGWPVFPVVLAGQVLHALASCVLGPALVAISLGLVGHTAISQRLGRNARFASIGNGLAAAAMGACGYLWSSRYVFVLTAVLAGPALLALSRIRSSEIDPERAHGGSPGIRSGAPHAGPLTLLGNRPLMILGGCVMMFHLANAAMLPIMGGIVTARSSHWATVLIAACIVVPQLVVAAISPWVGVQADRWGRRPLLLAGFAALPLRGMLFAFVSDPYVLVAVQVLDGISAAMLGVMVPLLIADTTRGTGHFNLAQGIVGSAIGIGASLSTTLAGFLSDRFGGSAAFLGLAALAAIGFAAVWCLLPETKPQDAPS